LPTTQRGILNLPRGLKELLKGKIRGKGWNLESYNQRMEKDVKSSNIKR